MEEDKLITMLRVSGLRTALWGMYDILYETDSNYRLNDFEREIKAAMNAIEELKLKCDVYLTYYVKNYNKE